MIKTKLISLNKLKFQRGYSYVSAFAIPFLVARELGEILPQFHWFFLFVAAIIGIWTLGHIDFKYGFWGNELEYSFTKNPEWERAMKKIIGKEYEKKIRKRIPPKKT